MVNLFVVVDRNSILSDLQRIKRRRKASKNLGIAICSFKGLIHSFLLLRLKLSKQYSIKRPNMKVIVERFADGRLKVMVRFEESSNFWVEGLTWVPKIDEVKLISEAVLAINEYDVVKRGLGKSQD